MLALQRKFGGEHRKEMFGMELRGGVQKANETLQNFALEIELSGSLLIQVITRF